MSNKAGKLPKRPSKLNTLKELRAPFEWLSAIKNKSRLSDLPKGDQRLIILVPGYGASERSMRPLSKFLKSLDYKVFDWGHGRNKGHIEQDTALLASTVESIRKKHSLEPVTLIGWSLGGVLSREVARLYPESVNEVITMGTPLIGGPKYTVLSNRYAKSKSLDLDQYEKEIHAINIQGITQPITVIYSKTDGIVGWQATQDNYNPQARNIEVSCSHLGMGVNSKVWEIIANTLAKSNQLN